MALKTMGKRRAPSELSEEIDEKEDAVGLALDGGRWIEPKSNKPMLPPSVGMARLNLHIATVFSKYADLIPIATDWNIRMDVRYAAAYVPLTFEAIATAPTLVTELGVAGRLRISSQVWSDWKRDHPELQEAIDIAMTIQHENLTARGIEDHINVAGLIMAMKNSPHRWRDKIEHDIGENIADLIRKAEENRKPVVWTDIGGQRLEKGSEGLTVIDAVAVGSGGEADDGEAEAPEELADEE
jgi:hypothetical protein